MYQIDAVVRRAPSLQRTREGRARSRVYWSGRVKQLTQPGNPGSSLPGVRALDAWSLCF